MSYRSGSVMHPQIETIAIGEIRNLTDEPALGVLLRKKLAERLVADGSVRLAGAGSADAVLCADVRRYTVRRSAATRSRDEDADDGRTAYRTSVYAVTVDVSYALRLPSQGDRAVLADRLVQGTADFPVLPDQEITRQSGLQQAVHDAATQVVAAITEAW
jgi:hypothetical protein